MIGVSHHFLLCVRKSTNSRTSPLGLGRVPEKVFFSLLLSHSLLPPQLILLELSKIPLAVSRGTAFLPVTGPPFGPVPSRHWIVTKQSQKKPGGSYNSKVHDGEENMRHRPADGKRSIHPSQIDHAAKRGNPKVEQAKTPSPDPDPSGCNGRVPNKVSHQAQSSREDRQQSTKYEQLPPTRISVDLNQSHFLNAFAVATGPSKGFPEPQRSYPSN